MPKPTITPEKTRLEVAARVASHGSRKAASQLGVAPETLSRVLRGKPVMPDTIERLAKGKGGGIKRIRDAGDFKAAAANAQRREQPIVAWDLERIRLARDAQMRGDFKLAVRLAEAMRTDDALFTAYRNRIAPQTAVELLMVPYEGVRGSALARRARESIFVPQTTIIDISGTLANHGIAIGYNHQIPNEEGTAVDFIHTEWPLEWVRWNPSREVLETVARDTAERIPIVHGDGRFTVYRKSRELPWTKDACLLPAAFIWAAHANGIRDWAAGSKAHGEAKVIGTLPEGIAVQLLDENGNVRLTDQALGFLSMLQDIMAGDNVGVMPFGTSAQMLTNTATMYQVFSELILDRTKAAQRVYLGSDAALGAAGGAPGVDISALFDIASTILQSDFHAIEEGLNTGVYQPWAAINDGDSRYAPSAKYQVPDPDADEKSEQESNKLGRLFDALDKYRANKMIIDQSVVNSLCALLGVSEQNVPQLAPAQSSLLVSLQPADYAKFISVGTALDSLGLPRYGDARDSMTISQLDAQNQNAAKGAADIATKAAPSAPAPAPLSPQPGAPALPPAPAQ